MSAVEGGRTTAQPWRRLDPREQQRRLAAFRERQQAQVRQDLRRLLASRR